MSIHEGRGHATHLFPLPSDALDAAATELRRVAELAIRARGRALFALSTSATCLPLYRRLASRAAGHAMWPYLVLVEADQRTPQPWSPQDFPQRLDGLLPVPAAHAIGAPLTDSVEADAADFARSVRMALELRRDERPTFDAVVVELGVDGGVAGNLPPDWAADRAPRLADASAATGTRLRLTTWTLAAASAIILLPSAEEHDAVVQLWRDPADAVLQPMRTALAMLGTPAGLYAGVAPALR